MPSINITNINNTTNAMLFELADCFDTDTFAETFVKVYDRFRYRGATRLQWRVLRNMFRDVFTDENKDAWRSILRLLRKTCITFPTASEGISFLWNGTIVANHGNYEGWVIEG